jgi:hypothetical protein
MKSHTAETIWRAFFGGHSIVKLVTDTGDDDILVGELEAVAADVEYHHDGRGLEYHLQPLETVEQIRSATGDSGSTVPYPGETLGQHIARWNLEPESDRPSGFYDLDAVYSGSPLGGVYVFTEGGGGQVVLDERYSAHSWVYGLNEKILKVVVIIKGYSTEAMDQICAVLDANEYNPPEGVGDYVAYRLDWVVRAPREGEVEGNYIVKDDDSLTPADENLNDLISENIDFYIVNTDGVIVDESPFQGWRFLSGPQGEVHLQHEGGIWRVYTLAGDARIYSGAVEDVDGESNADLYERAFDVVEGEEGEE